MAPFLVHESPKNQRISPAANRMIEFIGRANMDYMVRLANDPAWAQDQLRIINDDCAAKGNTYDGRAIPVPIKPHFISPRQRRLMSVGLQHIHSALEKFIKLWLESEDLQRMWAVNKEEVDLYRVDPGYPNAIQVARFDAFMHDYRLKFLEFNCDSPGGTGYADVIHQGFLDFFERNGLGGGYMVSDRSRMSHLGEALLDSYAAWRAQPGRDRPASPFTVVTDWRDVGSLSDINICVEHLRAMGVDAHFADPRDLELRGEELWLGDKRVDLIYKRVIVKELLRDPDASALTKAYTAGTVCMVNSPRSVIVGNKKILAALRRPDVLAIMNREERRAIEEHVPWTQVLHEGKVEFNEFVVNLRDFVVDNKAKLVLKAARSYGGRDVFLGFETDQATWVDLVEKHINGQEWVVQELVPIPKELFPKVDGESVNMELMNVNINPLAFNGKYCGSYTRLSTKNVINVSVGGGMTPTMTLEPKEEDH